MLERILSLLDQRDLRILGIIEGLRGKFEYVPLEVLEAKSRLPPSHLLSSLKKLRSLRLISMRVGSFTGYTITFRGLDILALHSLKTRGVIVRIGDRIGVGKEGEVYLAESPQGVVVVKLHRGGIRSFRKIKRHRGYVSDIPTDWIEYAKIVGEREFKVMSSLYKEGARVPKPLALNRHAVVQEYIEGVELYKVRELDSDTASRILDSILETMRIAYVRVGVVHGDLSEYNVLVSDSQEAYVIDWPQYVYIEDPMAQRLLRRDVEYILRFFKRRFNVSRDLEWAMRYVRGEVSEAAGP